MAQGMEVCEILGTKTRMSHRLQTGRSEASLRIVWLPKSLLCVVLVCDNKEHLFSVLMMLLGSFLPVTLEQLARERGVLWSDRNTSCMAKAASEANKTTASRLLSRAVSDNNQCIVSVLGWEMTTSSFSLYTFSLAVLVQALALVSFSSVADHGISYSELSMLHG